MSLKLYAPDEVEVRDQEYPNLSVYHDPQPDTDEDSEVLSWRFVRRNGQPSFIEAVQRSRLLHMHRRCQECGRPTVQPGRKPHVTCEYQPESVSASFAKFTPASSVKAPAS